MLEYSEIPVPEICADLNTAGRLLARSGAIVPRSIRVRYGFSLGTGLCADLIRLAVEAAGLKEEDTTGAVSRQLSRVRGRKKKIVKPRSRPKRGTRLLRARTRK